jgi:hypothetical protein
MTEGGCGYLQMMSFYAFFAANRLRDINIELENVFVFAKSYQYKLHNSVY